jgi:hypothetical protein
MAEVKVISPMKDHMKKLSSILGENFSPVIKCTNQPGSAELQKQTKVDKSIKEAAEEYEVDDFRTGLPKDNSKNIQNEKMRLTPLEINDNPDVEQDKMDEINFINILMYVKGEDKGVSVANDKQFSEIIKLMDEYYGLDEQKILNKYDIWKKYIRNLKMQRKCEERHNENIATINANSKTESKDEMISRYSAFLSRKWYQKADPFLKAKYKEYFKESEVKWGPNKIFKRLGKETQKLNKTKKVMEHKLNTETVYINNRIKVDVMNSPTKSAYSSRSIVDENSEKFLKLRLQKTLHQSSSRQVHERLSDDTDSPDHALDNISVNNSPASTTPIVSKPKRLSKFPKIKAMTGVPNESFIKLHRKLDRLV